MTTRAKSFSADDNDDLDLGRFTPKTEARPNPVPAELVKTVAEEGGFPSRSPTVVYVRYKTGRTVLLGARITQQSHDAFHGIVAEEVERYKRGEINHRPTLGEIVEEALAALIRERGEKAEMKYRVVQDTSGPYTGKWVIEQQDGRLLVGPFDTEDDAQHEVMMRERRGEHMVEIS